MPRKRNRRWRAFWITFVAIVLVVTAAVIYVDRQLGPGAGELRAAIDKLELPPEITLITDTSFGNRLCLDTCVEVQRFYASTLSMADTNVILVNALKRAGYQCFLRLTSQPDLCATSAPHRVSIWRQTDQLHLSMWQEDNPTAVIPSDVSINAAWRSYVNLTASLGRP